jgi:hypothetical protein
MNKFSLINSKNDQKTKSILFEDIDSGLGNKNMGRSNEAKKDSVEDNKACAFSLKMNANKNLIKKYFVSFFSTTFVVRKASILVEWLHFQAKKGTSVEAMKEAFLLDKPLRFLHR